MKSNEDHDHRYTRALELLEQHTGHHIDIKKIEDPAFTSVHDFNDAYKIIHELLWKTLGTLEDDDTLLVNISSGTPAMKSALTVLMALREYRGKCVQVLTPVKDHNEHVENPDYDIEEIWKNCADNNPDAEDRTRDIKVTHLVNSRDERLIKEMLQNYDYHAALKIARSIDDKEVTSDYIDLLEFAWKRSIMDLKGAGQINSRLNLKLLPMQGNPMMSQFEYALCCDLKQRRGEYADFLRALTPLFVEIFINVISRQLNFPMHEIIDVSINGPSWNQPRLDELADIEGNETAINIRETLELKYPNNFNFNGFVSSDHLCTIIRKLINNKRIVDLADTLRNNVELKLRNKAAHKMVSITGQDVKDITGLSVNKIMGHIKDLFKFSDLDISADHEAWNSYDNLNNLIMGYMKFDRRT